MVWGPIDRAESEIREMLARESDILHFEGAARHELISRDFDVRAASYPFSQLVDWKERMSFVALGRIPGVIGVDADERRKRHRSSARTMLVAR